MLQLPQPIYDALALLTSGMPLCLKIDTNGTNDWTLEVICKETLPLSHGKRTTETREIQCYKQPLLITLDRCEEMLYR